MPSSKIVKRGSLSVKYDFDIWGVSTGRLKSSGLAHRLYLKPRFVQEMKKATTRARNQLWSIYEKRSRLFGLMERGPSFGVRTNERSYMVNHHEMGHLDWRYPLNEYLCSKVNVSTSPWKYMEFYQKYRQLLEPKTRYTNTTHLFKKIMRRKFPKRRESQRLHKKIHNLKNLVSRKHYSWWKSATKKILRYRDPFPAFDRPKNQTQVYRARSFSNDLICKMIRVRMYFGFSKEYQFRTFLGKARNRSLPNHPSALAHILECRLPYMILRAGFVKNYEFAQYLVKLGCVTVNETPITDIHYIVPFRAWVRLKYPPLLEFLEQGSYASNRTFSYQRVALSSHFEINWKLMKVRLVNAARPRTTMFPFFTTSVGAISSFYSALGYSLRSEQYKFPKD